MKNSVERTMVKQCSIPNCARTHKKSSKVILTIFAPPTDINIRKKWSGLLNFILSKNSFVCEKHFRPEDVITPDIVSDGGKIIYKNILMRKILRKGALPLPVTENSPKKLAEKDLNLGSEGLHHNTNDILPKPSFIPVEIDIKNVSISESDKANMRKLFQQIFSQEIQIQLPGPKWRFFQTSSPERLIFSEIQSSENSTFQNTKLPILLKKVVLDEQFLSSIVFCQKRVELTSRQTPKSVLELENLLRIVNNLKLCAGGPKVRSVPAEFVRVTYRVDQSYWRHKKCSLVMGHRTTCKYCTSFHKLLSPTIKRKRKSNSNRILQSTKTRLLPSNTNLKTKLLIKTNQIKYRGSIKK